MSKAWAPVLRDFATVSVVAVYVLPIIWWGQSAFTPSDVLCFIFSWTEFILSLFLTQNMRLVPEQAGIFVMNMWDLISALTTAAPMTAFIFVMLMQRHFVRGLTIGLYK